MAETEFKNVFQKGDLPEEIPEFSVKSDMLENGAIRLDKLLVQANLTASASESKRLIKIRCVKIDGQKFNDSFYEYKPVSGNVIRVGKRKFIKII